MEKINLLPADTYTVVNQTLLTELDKKVIISLYEPLIGPISVSLYLSLWSDLDKLELISNDFNHQHLMVVLKSSLKIILEAREALEAVGLLKTYVKKNESVNEYLYELYSPLSPNEFFTHPVLGVLLYNNIGKREYDNLMNYYKKPLIDRSSYEEITKTMNETFNIVTPFEANQEEIRKVNRIGVNIDNLIDFDLLLDSLPKGFVNARTFNKRNKELINNLAFVYNVDTLKMAEFVRLSIEDNGLLDKERLRKTVRKNFEYNNNGSLPTIVFRSQPEYLQTPSGDNSNRGKVIKIFENVKPYDFLKAKNNGRSPSNKELQLLEKLAIDYELPAGVINVLIDFVLRMNDGKLSASYIESIAATWQRKKIKTVPDAMEVATKSTKVKKEEKSTTIKKSVALTPDWVNKENKKEEMSSEELEELSDMFKEFR